MFKKILEFSFLIIIIILFFNLFVSYSQDIEDLSPDCIKIHRLHRGDLDSIPGFVYDSLFNSLLDKAMGIQQTVDSIEEEALQYRKKIMLVADSYERIKLQQKVVIMEEHMKAMQSEADSLFIILDEMAKPEPEIQRSTILVTDTLIEGIKVYHYNLDELKKMQGRTKEEEPGKEGEAVRFQETEPKGSDFSILSQSLYSPEHPFENNFRIPGGVFYRIQLAAFSEEIKYNHFGGINPITTQVVDEGNITRYFAGKFTVYTEAESALYQVRSSGFKDAFIIGYYNAQRMSVERVREFENKDRPKQAGSQHFY